MRKESFFRMPREEAMELLAGADTVHLSTTTTEGAPVLRAMNSAIVGDRIVFHGSPVGEKTEAVGREVVISAIDTVASIPSYFIDAQRACPATTLYRSAQVHGTIVPIDDAKEKAAALRALLAKHQPEGGFVPLDEEHPLYRKAIASLLVFGVSLERLDGKAKLGQNRTPDERAKLLRGLWMRGGEGDLRALDLVQRACPGTTAPDSLRSPEGTVLSVWPTNADADEAAALLAPEYWNDRFTTDEIAKAHSGSSAWVVVRDDAGRVLASARAIADGAKLAWIYDVITRPDWRKRGLGDAVMRALLDHPKLRRARLVFLGTRDAQDFYARMGFRDVTTVAPRPYRTTQMLLDRAAAGGQLNDT